MPSIAYLIATYSGREHVSNKELSENVLQIQMDCLLQLLKNKKKSLMSNWINKIVIICPNAKNPFESYYQIDKWVDQFNIYNVPIKIVTYIGDNTHHSYDQWIQGWSCTESDYYILIEDDYCLNYETVTVEMDLYNLYIDTFPDNIGYLTTLGFDTPEHGRHMAITNGFVSHATLDKMNDALNNFYSYGWMYPQLNFSRMFTFFEIPFEDMYNRYGILFWNSRLNQMEKFNTLKEYIFVPIQYYILKPQCIYISNSATTTFYRRMLNHFEQ